MQRKDDARSIAINGMRDSYDPTAHDPRKAKLVENAYPQDSAINGAVVGRWGMRRSGNQLGSAGNRYGQDRIQYSQRDGTEHTLDVVGGLVYEFNWTTRTHTAIPLSGGVVLSGTARIFWVLYQDGVVFSDGVNKPAILKYSGAVWTWTLLTNAPVAYGQPVVKSAKLMFIKATERTTIVWSEEAAENLGYEAGGYNNAWQLTQTEQEGLYALCATEDYLYYARARSIGVILGDVTTDFRSSATVEGVSTTIGTSTPGGLVLAGDYVWLLDSDGHPQRFPLGGRIQEPEIWIDARETTRRLPRAYFRLAVICEYTPANLMLFGVVGVGADTPNTMLVYSTLTGEFLALFRGYYFTNLTMLKDADLIPTLGHPDATGYVYDHGSPQGTLWTDDIGGVATAIQHVVEMGELDFEVARSKRFDLVDYSLRLSSNLTALTFDYATPEGWSTPEVITSMTGSFAIYGIALYGVDKYSSSSLEQHLEIGIDTEARWIRPRLRHNGLGEQFGFEGVTVGAFWAGKIPESR